MKLKATSFVLLAFAISSTVMADCRKVVNIVNFVRALDPRQPKSEYVKAFDEEVKLNLRYGFPNTVLLQYDALVDAEMMAVARKSDAQKTEFGLWFEMSRPLNDAAGLPWKPTKDHTGWEWDWYINPGFLMAYDHSGRQKLIDAAFAKFKAEFGRYPKSVGSWLLDAWSMDYMTERYGVDGFCICREQDNTDAYGLRGGYSNGAYYPSKKNMLSAAVDMRNAVKSPVFKMLTPDPIYNYGLPNKLYADYPYTSGCPTLEPVWASGYERRIVDWFFRVYTESKGLLNLSYMQAGQENSFGWRMISRGWPYQCEKIAGEVAAGRITLEKMEETSRAFKAEHPVNCPQTQIALEDWNGNRRKSIWYNSRFYRANLLMENGRLAFRDIHKMVDDFEEPFLDKVCTGWQALYFTPPVIDTWMFRGSDASGDMALSGTFTALETAAEGEDVLVVTARRADGTSATIRFEEGRVGVTGADLVAEYAPESRRNLALKVGTQDLSFEFSGCRYRISVEGALKATEKGFTLQGGHVALDFADQVETWRMMELEFTAAANYDAGGGDAVRFEAAFSNRTTGVVVSRPGFWDGGARFLVRFAPTTSGEWDWSTTSDDSRLNGQKGTLSVVPYKGKLDIYRHGFLKVEPGKKHFVHADGTPFFYLGDTHWGLYKEEIDEPGPHAGATGAKSHFKYIVDRRAEQGFTVYQSEPIGCAFHLEDGRVDAADIPGFRLADRYYQHIADAGLVHANACFFFASMMNEKLAKDDVALARISRYWVARFGAYPVLWTLAQEIDNDFYSERGDHPFYNYTNNPWVKVAEYLHREDAYSHPLSGHQENTGATTVTGRGTNADKSKISGNGVSVFADSNVTARTGHNWWAAQWSPSLTSRMDFQVPYDYWISPKPAVNYEGRYCGLWTKDTGARAQGWIAFLTGFCGYGYGAIDMWLYQSTYDIKNTSRDGVDVITPEDKAQPWSMSIEYPSALQMAHLKKFLTSFDWWNLKPDLGGGVLYDGAKAIGVHAVAGTRHVFYFYGKGREAGTLKGLAAKSSHVLRWFNPRTGVWEQTQTLAAGDDGMLVLPQRPDEQDWALELVPCR